MPATPADSATPAEPAEEPRFPTGPNGRLETQKEYEERLAVNAKMRFHRSLQSTLARLIDHMVHVLLNS